MSYLPFRNSVHLTQAEAYDLMHRMLSGQMDTDQIAEVLGFLQRKGETLAEVVGFASAIRDMSTFTPDDLSDEPLLDTCGTGGDGACTFNISTATAFVIAGAGLRVAKHGNRRISSQCGSADVLEQLGVPFQLSPEQIRDSVREIGIAFLYAPLLHPAIKQAQEARLLLKGRTVFNLLGPLTNPAKASIQLIGAYSVRAAEILAHASARLGIQRAFVVHGSDGLDEITITGNTTVFQVEDGRVQKGRWQPGDFGVSPCSPDDLRGSDAASNAEIIRRVLEGEKGPRRDVVIANTAAALFLAKRAIDLRSAVEMANTAIDSGAALRKLELTAEWGAKFLHEAV